MTSRYEEVMKTKNFLPFHLDHLTPKMIKKAKDELKETDEIRGPALQQMKKLVFAEKHLRCPTEDEYLIQFLRARKFDVDKAFELLRNKYEVKKGYSDLYDDADVNELRKFMASGIIYAFPYRDEEGCVVIVLHLSRWDPDEFNISLGLCALTGLLLYAVDNPATQICGVRILVDARGFTFKQMRCVAPRYINLLSRALRNCLPIRFKGIHFFNESAIFQYVWSVLRLFLTDKIKNRAHIHGSSLKNLHKSIPKEILSADYGGDNTAYNGSEWCVNEMEKFYEKYIRMCRSGFD